MNTIKVRTMTDLFRGYKTAEVYCLYTGNLARKLSYDSKKVTIDALTVTVEIDPLTEIHHQPWVMDRGNLLFYMPGDPQPKKLCGVHDVIKYPDGTEFNVDWG